MLGLGLRLDEMRMPKMAKQIVFDEFPEDAFQFIPEPEREGLLLPGDKGFPADEFGEGSGDRLDPGDAFIQGTGFKSLGELLDERAGQGSGDRLDPGDELVSNGDFDAIDALLL